MTPTEQANGAKTLTPTKTLFDLDTMSDVTLFKSVEFTPVTSTKEALERLQNNAEKFLKVINDGLESEAARAAKEDNSIPWMVENDEGESVAFEGTPADSKAVNGLVLNLAKSVFGYTKESSKDEKRTAKESALQMVKNTPAIVEGLKKNAAA